MRSNTVGSIFHIPIAVLVGILMPVSMGSTRIIPIISKSEV
ncbi:MAG: hypothetical protein ACJZ40_01520 [Candidatus Poseidoniaceae archaeon]